MSSLPARMKKIQSKMNVLEGPQHFPVISLWGFLQMLKAASSAVRGQIFPNFDVIREVFLVTCKNEDPIKMKVLEKSQHFLYHNPMGAICCHGNQSSDLIFPLLQWLFRQNLIGLRDINVLKLFTNRRTDAGSSPIQ